ncbi:MAG: anti-sigma factor [Waddliaceae bacterium]|nr:anti-sigma factor [Waddliaceae bacterium]
MIEERVDYYIHSQASLSSSLIGIRSAILKIGFKEPHLSKVLTTVSELGMNVLKYAKQGKIYLCHAEQKSKKGIEICVKDWGPGIQNIDQAMEESFSSIGTLGLGLPGVKRMADEFLIESEPLKGTTVKVTFWK